MRDPFTILLDRMDGFDTKLDGLATDIGTLKADVGTLKGDVGTLKGDVGTLKGDVGTLKGDVRTIKGMVANQGVTLQEHTVMLLELNSDVKEIKEHLHRHDAQLLELHAASHTH